MKRKWRILFLVGLTWFLVHCSWVTWDGLRPFTGSADVAVVLGNAVQEDGTLSPWLQGRVDQALQLYRNKQVKKIFVSGGVGKTTFPEGDAMRNYLVAHGVDSMLVIVDNEGSNSYLTAKHLVELRDKEHFSSAVLVTSYYHVTRCKYIARKLGFDNVAGDYSRAFFWQDIFGLAREFVAFYKYVLVY